LSKELFKQGLKRHYPMPSLPVGKFEVKSSFVISRATKSQWSQIFSAFFKAYERSTNQISSSYCRGVPSY